MAIIQELSFFSWKNFQNDLQTLGDLERFKLVIETIPDKELISKLIKQRGFGRNDYPIQAMWNSILAGIVFEHISIESLRRELRRNAQLRELCGFNPLLGINTVPSKSAYNRFLSNLLKEEALVRKMFNSLVLELMLIDPKFGTILSGDGKALNSFGKPSTKKKGDNRCENDADWGKKTYSGVDKNGKAWQKVKSWFGFRLHLIAEGNSELPVAYKITQASKNEQPIMREVVADLNTRLPELVQRSKYGLFDKGYDSTETICMLWDKYKIKPIVDIRSLWKDGDKTRQLQSKSMQNVTYNYKGTVFCHCPKTDKIREMAYNGFEKRRNTLKYMCPALAYGIECQGAKTCPLYRKKIRIPLEEDRRIFTPVARSSYKWQTLYDKRSSIERINSRIDMSFGFERHYIRGLKKMTLRCGLALSVMLALAVGRLRQKRPDLMRSLVKVA